MYWEEHQLDGNVSLHPVVTCAAPLTWFGNRSKLVPTLLMHFDLVLANPSENWRLKCWWFVYQEGIEVRLIPRKPSS